MPKIGLPAAAEYIASGRLKAYRVGPRLIKVDLNDVEALKQPVGGGDVEALTQPVGDGDDVTAESR
ncbi:MAG: hypothetical protein J2P17_08305 [Mycobacterium sp.]|nr:hypothetical protein [Mycobacterium sp.]